MRGMIGRREFLIAATAVAGLRAAAKSKITRIRLAPVECRFHKYVAMNSYDTAPKGHTYTNTLVRIETDQGVEGVGVLGYAGPQPAMRVALAKLVGTDPAALYVWEGERIRGRAATHADILQTYRWLDGPLFDVIGKLSDRPAWRLLGDSVRDEVEVYDGTLYFSDIWFQDRGVGAVVEEAEEAAKKGYRGMKLKLGRGWKWMPAEQGLLRDIEVVRAVRRAVSPDIKVMADANDGFRNDHERGWELMEATAAANVYWMEELFPEDVGRYTELRARMQKAGIRTLIADGENLRQPADFDPFLKPRRLMDVLQLDIRQGGFLDNAALAKSGESAGAVTIPHNWGSQIGVFMGLQIARAVRGVAAAEDDRSTCDVIQADGYEFRGGRYRVPDRAGMAIHVDEKRYASKCAAAEMVIT